MGIGEFERYVKNCRKDIRVMSEKKGRLGKMEKTLATLKMFDQCTNNFEEQTLMENLREELELCSAVG